MGGVLWAHPPDAGGTRPDDQRKQHLHRCHPPALLGAGLAISSACDLHLASRDALFSLLETGIAIVANMGSLNRLPRIIGQGNARMMAFTGRDFTAEEALRMGLVNEFYENREALMAGALSLAAEIAENAAPAVWGSKRILAYMENHSLDDGLKYSAAWNSAFLNTRDIQDALKRAMEKKAKKG